MGMTAGYTFFGACALAWAAIAHNRGQAMGAQNRDRAAWLWYTAALIPIAAAAIFFAQAGEIAMWPQRILLGVIGAAIGAAALIALGEFVRPKDGKVMDKDRFEESEKSASKIEVNGGENVISIGQIGGITAKNVLINSSTPEPKLQIKSRNEIINNDGSFSVNIDAMVISKLTPGLMKINISAFNIIDVRIMTPSIDGVSTIVMHNVHKSSNHFSAEIPGPHGQYNIFVRTASKTNIELDATF